MNRSLDMGCGNRKQPAAIGIDILPLPGVDVVVNLDQTYPFRSDTFDLIYCTSVLEHLSDLVAIMREIYRLLKPGGQVHIVVPFFSSVYFHTDPTHKHSFCSSTFDYFVWGTSLYQRYQYAPDIAFEKVSVEYEAPGIRYRPAFERPLIGLANRFKNLYEKRLAYIYPVHDIYLTLRALKPHP
jgi:SAM-dependent methyltransferase